MSNTEARARWLNAGRVLDYAERNCPHWDYQSDTSALLDHDCCLALKAAHEGYKAARAEFSRSKDR